MWKIGLGDKEAEGRNDMENSMGAEKRRWSCVENRS